MPHSMLSSNLSETPFCHDDPKTPLLANGARRESKGFGRRILPFFRQEFAGFLVKKRADHAGQGSMARAGYVALELRDIVEETRVPTKIAQRGNQPAVVEVGTGLEPVDNDGNSPLMAAVIRATKQSYKPYSKPDSELARLFKQSFGSKNEGTIERINRQNNKGQSILHLLAIGGYTEYYKSLVNLGGNRELEDNEGYTPQMKLLTPQKNLHINSFMFDAARISKIIVCSQPTGRETAIDTENKKGITVVHMIIGSDCPKLLLGVVFDHVQDKNKIYHNGQTLLHYAINIAWGRELSAVKILIKHGADVNARNAYGETPMDRSFKEGRPTCYRLLEKKGGKSTLKESDRLVYLGKLFVSGKLITIKNAVKCCDLNKLFGEYYLQHQAGDVGEEIGKVLLYCAGIEHNNNLIYKLMEQGVTLTCRNCQPSGNAVL